MKKRELSKYLAKIGSKGGKKAAAGMTKEQRVARARKASMVYGINTSPVHPGCDPQPMSAGMLPDPTIGRHAEQKRTGTGWTAKPRDAMSA